MSQYDTDDPNKEKLSWSNVDNYKYTIIRGL